MDGRAERASELTAFYLDGEISEDELTELESLIRDHEEARIAFLNGAHLHSTLTTTVAPTVEAEMASQARLRAMKRPRMSKRSRPAPRRRRRTLWTVGALMAASLVVAAGLGHLFWPRETRDLVVAKINAFTGDVTVKRDGKEFNASEGTEILEGDSVMVKDGATAQVEYLRREDTSSAGDIAPLATGETPPGGGVKLTTRGDSKINVAYTAEETSIALTGDTDVKLWTENGAKRIDLEAGALECELDQQPLDKSMVFKLPNSEALEVDSRRIKVIASPDLTELEVDGGSARLSRGGKGWPLWLGPGFHVIRRGRKGSSSARQGETWPPPAGKVLLEESFSGGFTNWRLLRISDSGGRAAGRPAVSGRGFQVTESTRGGRRLKALEIDARSEALGVELREALGGKAYVIDYEWRVDSLPVGDSAGEVSAAFRLDALFGGGKAIELSGGVVSAKPGVWIRQRVQIEPMSGERGCVATEWVDGKRMRSFRFSRPDESGIRLVYKGASVRLRNILIREP